LKGGKKPRKGRKTRKMLDRNLLRPRHTPYPPLGKVITAPRRKRTNSCKTGEVNPKGREKVLEEGRI